MNCVSSVADHIGVGFRADTLQYRSPVLLMPLSQNTEVMHGAHYNFPSSVDTRQRSGDSLTDASRAYQDYTAWSRDLATSLGVEANTGTYQVGGAAQGSLAVSNTISRGSMWMERKRKVTTHYAVVQSGAPLDIAFESEVHEMNEQLRVLQPDATSGLLSRFFEDWGTHYVSEVEIGGQVETTAELKQCCADGSLVATADAQSAMESRATSGRVETALREASSSSICNQFSNEFRNIYGGNHDLYDNQDENAWAESVRNGVSPVVVGKRINPIWRLFETRPEYSTIKDALENYYEEFMAGRSVTLEQAAEVECLPQAEEEKDMGVEHDNAGSVGLVGILVGSVLGIVVLLSCCFAYKMMAQVHHRHA
jgi:hypothetical protein